MNPNLNRREFVGAAAAAGLTLAVAGRAAWPKTFKHPFHKAVMCKPIADEATLQEIKDAGFEGIESSIGNVTPDEAKAARKRAENVGLVIHSVLARLARFQ